MKTRKLHPRSGLRLRIADRKLSFINPNDFGATDAQLVVVAVTRQALATLAGEDVDSITRSSELGKPPLDQTLLQQQAAIRRALGQHSELAFDGQTFDDGWNQAAQKKSLKTVGDTYPIALKACKAAS